LRLVAGCAAGSFCFLSPTFASLSHYYLYFNAIQISLLYLIFSLAFVLASLLYLIFSLAFVLAWRLAVLLFFKKKSLSAGERQ
jgi:hypothetical protein